jgi:ABC-type phosphate transport system substrate-binding protein
MNARVAVIAILVGAGLVGPAYAGDLVVIVHPDRDVRLTRDEVAQIYLKRRRFWKNGETIVPVNRNSASPERDNFVRHVFGDDVRRLAVYWNRQYFRGVLPPATLASDEAVKRFVASEPLAIGYIPSELVDPSVRVVFRIDSAEAGRPGSRASLVDAP